MASTYLSILQAVVATIQGLNLAGVPASQVYLMKTIREEGVLYPAIFVTRPGFGERRSFAGVRGDTGSRWWGYPVNVAVVTNTIGDNTVTDDESVWRETLADAFEEQFLAGVLPQVWNCLIEPGPILDEKIFRELNLSVGSFTLWFWVSRPRVGGG